jgi:hypothetical protein
MQEQLACVALFAAQRALDGTELGTKPSARVMTKCWSASCIQTARKSNWEQVKRIDRWPALCSIDAKPRFRLTSLMLPSTKMLPL